MEQQIIEILKRIEGKVDSLENRFDGLEGRFDGLEGRFDKLESKVDENTRDIKEIKQKIDSVYEQTADLTEFRTETKIGMENIRKDISEFSNATMINCYDIAKLRAIK